MELIGLLVVLAIIIIALNAARSRVRSDTPVSPPPPPQPSKSKGSRETYRPGSGSARHPAIRFGQPKPKGFDGVSGQGLGDLKDAFTGQAINPSRGALYRCTQCQVIYHSDSVEVIRAENNGECVACQSAAISRLETTVTPPHGRTHSASVVTLANYASYVGRVVTFEGAVQVVHASRDGKSFAVMFEAASWAKGFKMVVFRNAVDSVGGASFLRGLSGKTIRVRGLLVNHRLFGYQIIVSERSMILSAL